MEVLSLYASNWRNLASTFMESYGSIAPPGALGARTESCGMSEHNTKLQIDAANHLKDAVQAVKEGNWEGFAGFTLIIAYCMLKDIADAIRETKR
jgi:hypothetical protein